MFDRYFSRRRLLCVSLTGTLACLITLMAALTVVQHSSQPHPPTTTLASNDISTPSIAYEIPTLLFNPNRLNASLLNIGEGFEPSVPGDEGGGGGSQVAGVVAMVAMVALVIIYGVGIGPVPYTYAAG